MKGVLLIKPQLKFQGDQMMRTAANRQFKVEFLSFFRNFLRNSLELSFVCRTLAVFCFLAVVAIHRTYNTSIEGRQFNHTYSTKTI